MSRYPYDPAEDADWREVTYSHKTQHGKYASANRAAIPRMEGNARVRALHKLAAKTEVRRGREGREFLLHRGDDNHQVAWPGWQVTHPFFTGWSPYEDIARGFGRVNSAWVKEQDIHTIPKQLGRTSPYKDLDMKDPTKPKWKLGENQYADEYEVVVAPNHQSTAAEWKPRSTRADDLKFRLRMKFTKSPQQRARERAVGKPG